MDRYVESEDFNASWILSGRYAYSIELSHSRAFPMVLKWNSVIKPDQVNPSVFRWILNRVHLRVLSQRHIRP